MMITVRSCSMAWIDSCASASSSWVVDSSRMTMCGLASAMRARASCWIWSRVSSVLPIPTRVSNPLFISRHHVAPTASSALCICSVVACGAATFMFSARVPMKRCASWVQMRSLGRPSVPASVGKSPSPTRWPMTCTLPFVAVKEPEMRRARVVLPDPDLPIRDTDWPVGISRLISCMTGDSGR